MIRYTVIAGYLVDMYMVFRLRKKYDVTVKKFWNENKGKKQDGRR